jgi:ATP-dependent DNA helicase RecG
MQRLIAKGESDVLEFKASFGKDVIETLCAFANHRGGTVLIGVADDGKIIGTSCGSESLQAWANEIKQNTTPSIIPDVEMISIRGKSVVIFRVSEFPVKPVAFRDRYFKRVANSNHRMSLTEMANIHMQSLQLSWDSYPEDQATVKDLSPRKMKTFLKRVREGGRFKGEGDWQVVLEKLGYLKNGAPTHAAMILFGKNDPPYQLHIGRFKTPSTIIDDRMMRGTLFDVVDDAMKFILSHIKVAFEITGDIQRREIPEYPPAALRELLLNAVVHRDYTSPTDIQIKIFDNAITFFNPGRLYGDLTIEKLKTDSYQSRTRNKLIAEAFYLTRDIEKYGSGYIRIRREIADYPTMSFDYEESGDGFLVNVNYQEQKTVTTPKKATPKKATPKKATPKKATPKKREKLLELIGQNSRATREELAKQLGISINGVKQHILKLKKEGLLARVGGHRFGVWQIKS